MATFIQSHPSSMGDFPFGTCLDGISLTPSMSGCLMTPPPYRISLDSPAPRNNMAFQPVMNQVADSSFFDEAIGTSTAQADIGLGFPSPAPQYDHSIAKIPENPDNSGPPKATSSSVQCEQKPPRRAATRRRPQANQGLGITEIASDEPKTKKRGRKPRGEPKRPAKELQKEDSDDEEVPKDPRRRRVLERNRIAATKCRMRKRDEASALASREQAMEDRNRYLSSCFDSLTAEIYHLKTQLLRHTDCNCVLIQKYIASEAKKSVDGLAVCSSAFQLTRAPSIASHRGSSGSVTSGTESYSIRTPDMEGLPPTWTNPFQPGSRSPDAVDDRFGMVLEMPQKDPLLMSSQPMASISPMSGCGPGMFVSPGIPLQSPGGMGWESQWDFR